MIRTLGLNTLGTILYFRHPNYLNVVNLSHYFQIYIGYGLALLGWYMYYKHSKDYGKKENEPFKYPWMEFLFALLAAFLTLGIGQLYLRGLLLSKSGSFGFITESLNQLIIFSPFLILLGVRGQKLTTAWIPREGRTKSIFVGLAMAVLALIVVLLLKGRSLTILSDIYSLYSHKNLPHLVQVFAEDLAISICLCRLIAWIGERKAIVLIAMLFALGHIPAMIVKGIALENFAGLIFDTFLGFFALKMLANSRNFLWFWMIHYAMDMTQFLD